MSMKVAVTGAYGFLGTHLSEYYFNKGAQVIRIGRGDIELEQIQECDLLVHCAGINRADTPEQVYEGNINIAKRLVSNLEALKIKIPIKYISTISEGDDTAYGQSKNKSKTILKKYCVDSNVIFESYKLPNLFGTRGRPYYNSFVNTFAYNIANGIECEYNSNPISLCHVSDAIKVIDNQTKDFKLYNTTVEEVYKRLKNIGKSEFDIKLEEILNYYKNPIKIFVLGHNGMLGHVVYKVLSQDLRYKVGTTDKRFPDWDKTMFEGYDYIIDCIGAVPQKTDQFDINWKLPMWLSENTSCKIIHPATDCEHDSTPYGISKRKSSDYIKTHSSSTKIIQTSIIGPEIKNKFGLMEWFLAQTGEVEGYTNAIWNGVTTLEWARYCKRLIDSWNEHPTLTILYTDGISKYDLLKTFQKCFNKENIQINPKNLGHDRTLKGTVQRKSIEKQLLEVKSWMEENKTLYL